MSISSSWFTVLITGASSGIGRSLALLYAKQNVFLILLGRNEEELEALSLKCQACGAKVKLYCIDLLLVAESECLSREIASKYQVDLFIANAGVTNSTKDNQLEPWGKIESLITANLMGALAITHGVLEGMQNRRNGHVAYVSSLGAYYGMPVTPAYCASKAGIKAYAEAMRGLLAPHSVNVTLITPGFVKTKLSDQFAGDKPFMISADNAAKIIKRGLDRKRKVIAFPVILVVGMRILSCLPAGMADFILSRLKY